MARAAMQAPLCLRRYSIWHPFDVHTWKNTPDATDPTNPTKPPMPVGGESATEAAQVAWLMSCSPYVNASVVPPLASALAYATHMSRESAVADALYQRLAKTAGNVVLKDIEDEMNCRLEEVEVELDGSTRRVDPYCSKQLVRTLEDSVRAHVSWLDATMTCMQGLEASQHGDATQDSMDTLVTAVSRELSKWLMDRNLTTVELVQRLSALSGSYGQPHVDLLKTKLRADARAAHTLGRLCFAADAPAHQAQIFYGNDHDLIYFLCFPPECFAHYLKVHSVPTEEVASVMRTLAGATPAAASTIPPAPMSVVFSMLQRWIRAHRSVLTEACASTVSGIAQALRVPYTHPHWSGVKLCRVRDNVQAHPLSQNAAPVRMPWKAPDHLDFDGRELVCFTPTHYGVRACRLFAVLLEEAKLGLLPARTFRASALVAVVSRFTSDRELSQEQLVSHQLKPLGDSCGHAWPGEVVCKRRPLFKRSLSPERLPLAYPVPVAEVAGDATARPEDAPVPTVPPVVDGFAAVPMAPRPPDTAALAAAASMSDSSVPTELKRDHMVLMGLNERLRVYDDAETVRGMVSVDEVFGNMRWLFPIAEQRSDSSLRQTAAVVLKRLMEKCHAAHTGSIEDVVYTNTRISTDNKRASGVSFSRKGLRLLKQFLAVTLWQMRHNGHEFNKQWFDGAAGVTYARKLAKTM